MKKFRLSPIAIAVASLAVGIPTFTASSQAASGDLNIYSPSTADKSPTLMLVVEGSTFTNLADGIPEVKGETEIIGFAKWSNTVPRYKRFGYYMGLSNVGGTDESKYYPTRLTRMKDAMFYLMDTPNLLPDNFKIGLTRYSGGTTVKDNPTVTGDSHTANVVIPAKPLGPVITSYDFIKDGAGNFVEERATGKKIEVQYPRYAKLAGSTATFYQVAGGRYVKKAGVYFTKNIQDKYVPNDAGNFVYNTTSSAYEPITADYFIDLNDTGGTYTLDSGGKRLEVYSQTCSGKDANGNPVTDSQRCLIKKYIAEMCDSDILCTGDAPMAVAYAEAGAYMMGTKTATLVAKPGTVDPDTIVYPRVLRQNKSTKKWEYCEPRNRMVVQYKDSSATSGFRYRIECPDTLAVNNGDGTTSQISGWTAVNSANVANWNWAGADDQADDTELANVESQRNFDLLWVNAGDSPYGTTALATTNKLASYDLAIKKYDYNKDTFTYRNPNKDATTGEATSIGTQDTTYDYWLDANANPQSGLYPQVLYRPFRKKIGTLGSTTKWQYCPLDSARLINFEVASFRLTCDESGDRAWVDIDKDHLTGIKQGSRTIDVKVNGKQIAWDSGWFDTCNVICKPAGMDSPLTSKLAKAGQYFLQDSLLSPYDGWQYYYDVNYDSDILMPPTLLGVSGYRASSIRNADVSVRGDKSYTYQQPSYSQCSGKVQYDASGREITGAQSVENAIMFITAGKPNMDATYSAPVSEMNMSLSPANSTTLNVPVGNAITACTSGDGKLNSIVGNGNNGQNFWCEIGEYSKRLRKAPIDSTTNYQNPADVVIKTGTFVFAAPSVATKMATTQTNVDGTKKYDCTAVGDLSIQNACRLGQYGEGFGEGGFFLSASTDPKQSYQDLAEAIIKMANNTSNNIGLVPTGMPAVPSDPLNPNALSKYSYLPLISPTPNSNTAQWAGNLRKYKQSTTTNGYIDRDGRSPFASNLNSVAATLTNDFWNFSKTGAVDVAYPSASQDGGAYKNIPLPTKTDTTTQRTVYLSKSAGNVDATASTDVATTGADLTTYQVKPSDIENIKAIEVKNVNNVSNQTVTNQDELRTLLLNYMGYNLKDFRKDAITVTNTDGSKTTLPATTAADITNSLVDTPTKYLGGVINSTPISLVTKATLDSTTNKYKPDNQYVLFGAMDNALHIVSENTADESAATGKEVLSYFPREVLAEKNGEQYKAITTKLPMTNGPARGVDAPWASYVQYGGAGTGYSTIEAKQLYVYGGAGLGAKAYYGLNLTGLGKASFTPRELFAITPNTTYAGKKVFSQLGYTMGKPVITKIKWQGKPKLVAILSGGYDTTYDTPDLSTVTATTGNGVYIVDALTGQPLIVASDTFEHLGTTGTCSDNLLVNAEVTGCTSTYNGANDFIPVTNSKMAYSVVGSVKTLDRDADELTDNIYFADLNGQVFRLDINNAASTFTAATTTTSATAKNPTVRLVRLANLSSDLDANGSGISKENTKPGPRFYESPVVTVHTNKADGQRFIAVSVASGNKSSPTYTPASDYYSMVISYTNASGTPDTLTVKKGTNGWEKVNHLADTGITVDANGVVKFVNANGIKTDRKITAQVYFQSMETLATSYDGKAQTPAATGRMPTISVAANSVTITPATLNLPEVKPNAVYVVYDKDAGQVGLYQPDYNLISKDVNVKTNFVDFASSGTFTDTQPSNGSGVIVSNYSKNGWTAPLNVGSTYNPDGTVNTRITSTAIKTSGPLAALGGKLYIPTYNPNDGLTDLSGCTSQVLGATEGMQFCLPYGICKTNGAGNTQYQSFTIGKGMQSIMMGDAANAGSTTGIGRTILTQNGGTTLTNLNPNNNASGNMPSVKTLWSMTTRLRPLAWYDMQLQKNGLAH